jgi:hypothetical protein
MGTRTRHGAPLYDGAPNPQHGLSAAGGLHDHADMGFPSEDVAPAGVATMPVRTGFTVSDDETLGATVETIRDPTTTPSAHTVHAWAVAGPEVVRWTAVGQYGADPATLAATTRQAVATRAAVLRGALADADTEGVVWTPLLDRIDTTGLWARVLRDTRGPGSAWDRTLEGEAAAIAAMSASLDDTLPGPEERTLPLAVWARYGATAETLRAALTAKASIVLRTLARHANPEALSAEVVEEILSSVAVAEALAMNVTLPPAAVGSVARWAWARVSTLTAAGPPLGEFGGAQRAPTPPALPWEAHPAAERLAAILAGLARTAGGLPDDMRDTLAAAGRNATTPQGALALRVLLSDPRCDRPRLGAIASFVIAARVPALTASLLLHPCADRALRDATWASALEAATSAEGAAAAVVALAAGVLSAAGASPIPEDVWVRVIARVDTDDTLLGEVARHPQASPAIVREAARRVPSSLPALAARRAARWDPDVRAILWRSDVPAVLSGLLVDAMPGDWEALFARLLTAAPAVALERLARGGPPPGTLLDATPIRALALSGEASVARAAASILGRFGL